MEGTDLRATFRGRKTSKSGADRRLVLGCNESGSLGFRVRIRVPCTVGVSVAVTFVVKVLVTVPARGMVPE